MITRLFPQDFQTRVTLALILASLVPLALVGWFFFSLANRNLIAETGRQLTFARDAEASEVLQYLGFVQREAHSVASSTMVRYAVGDFYGFGFGFRQAAESPDAAAALLRHAFGVGGIGDAVATEPAAIEDRLLRDALDYANVHRRFHREFSEFVAQSEFDNLYLINTTGRVVYSVRPDNYLGADLTGSRAPLGVLHAALGWGDIGSREPIFTDFAQDPMTGGFSALLGYAVPLYNNAHAAIVFRLPVEGLGRLLGSDAATAILSAQGDVIATTQAAGLQEGRMADVPPEMLTGAKAGIAALDRGLTGDATLSAWSRLGLPARDWLVVTEIPQARAFATSRSLRDALLIIGTIAVLVLVPLALALSHSITGPMRQLARKSMAIAEGALNEDLPQYSRPREYADLSRAVRKMRDSLRRQLDLIRDKNVELQRSVTQIAEKNAALETADRMKDQFLAATSHELRTPLNGIIGISETLGTGALGEIAPVQKNQLQLIALSARRLSRLVDDLLDIYRIREGRMRLDMQRLDIAQCLTGAIELARPMLSGEGVTLHLRVAEDTPPAHADPVRVEQILFNLLSNALKYGDGTRIEITAAPHEVADRPGLAVAIRDFGAGISPDSLERVFHPLEQITGAARRIGAHQGTGLGLTIARNLAKLMGGTITVDSTLGVGSTFTLLLPALDRQLPGVAPTRGLDLVIDAARPEPMPTAQDGDRSAPTILIVDDEPVNLQVLKNVLLPQGYRVLDCDNGPEALRLVETAQPDLVVLDVMMDGMDGLEVARRLRRRHDLLDLPIILLTARGRSRDIIEGFEAGANDYVVKPFVKDELLSRIGTLLKAASAKRQAEENVELRQEIERRIQVEDALRLSQRRVGQLLDSLEDGLIFINPRNVISYANAAASYHAGMQIVPGTTTLAGLLPVALQDALSGLDPDDDPRRLVGQIGDRMVTIHAFALLPDCGGGLALLLDAGGAEKPRLLASVRDAVDSSLASLPLADDPVQPQATAQSLPVDALRTGMVAVMTDVLALWRFLTGNGKIDFAETSGLWRVSVDKSSLQTRTLDKYLLIETLPANPRWRDVLLSAEFVLDRAANAPANETPEVVDLRQRLTDRLAQMRGLLPAAG